MVGPWQQSNIHRPPQDPPVPSAGHVERTKSYKALDIVSKIQPGKLTGSLKYIQIVSSPQAAVVGSKSGSVRPHVPHTPPASDVRGVQLSKEMDAVHSDPNIGTIQKLDDTPSSDPTSSVEGAPVLVEPDLPPILPPDARQASGATIILTAPALAAYQVRPAHHTSTLPPVSSSPPEASVPTVQQSMTQSQHVQKSPTNWCSKLFPCCC